MAGLWFNWFTLGQKKLKLSCVCLFPWKPINLNGITEYICDIFHSLHASVRRDKTRPRDRTYREKGWTWRISRWQIGFFALWQDTGKVTEENVAVSTSIHEWAATVSHGACCPPYYNAGFQHCKCCGFKENELLAVSRAFRLLEHAKAPFLLSFRRPCFCLNSKSPSFFSSSAPSLSDFVLPAVERKESLKQGECRDVL